MAKEDRWCIPSTIHFLLNENKFKYPHAQDFTSKVSKLVAVKIKGRN
jgi:hypothetical protein